jgi:hypothetical protein
MANGVAVGPAVAALAGAGVLIALIVAWTRRYRPFAPGGHALTRSGVGDPLARPLRHGYGSIEVAIWLDRRNRLQVGASRSRAELGTTIEPLVLAPLAARVARHRGRVHPAQRGPFILMIDIAESEPARQAAAYEELDRQLRAYPDLLTRCADGEVVPGPALVVLTGANVPRHLLAAQPDRLAFCDGSFGDIGAWGAPAHLVPVVSEHWSWRFGWDGRDDMPAEERHLLRGLVAAARAEGRRVRIFGVPERSARVRQAYWRELADAGVDLVSGYRLAGLARYLRRRSAVHRYPAPGARRRPRYAMIDR